MNRRRPPFISKINIEEKIIDRYWIAFATFISGLVDFFTIPFGYVCNYQVDVIEKVVRDGIERRKKSENRR